MDEFPFDDPFEDSDDEGSGCIRCQHVPRKPRAPSRKTTRRAPKRHAAPARRVPRKTTRAPRRVQLDSIPTAWETVLV